MKNVIDLQLELFILVALGFILKKLKILSDTGEKELTDLVIYVVLPCNILNAFMVDIGTDAGQEITAIFIISICIQIFSVLYGKLLYKNEKSIGKKKCLIYGTICSNAGFLGNPISEGLFGSYGLLLASIFLIPLRVMMWTEGIATFSGSTDKKKTAITTITHPCILACAFGLVFLVTNLELPSLASKTIQAIGGCNTALSMIVIGMILADIDLHEIMDEKVLKYSLSRLAILPLVVYLLTYFLPVTDIVKNLSTILVAMPAGATTSMLAVKYNTEPKFGTKLVITSTLFSMITIPIWSMILL